MTLTQILLLIILGLLSGFINMFAGGGSMLVVPFLIFLDLPANMANATNRVAIFLQNIVSTTTFKQKKILDFKTDYKLLIPTCLGCAIGAYTAVDTQDDILEKVIGGLLIIMFFMVLLDPSSWIKTNIEHAKAKNPILRFIIFLGIGFYGGFIQIGVGFFMLAGLVLGCGFDLLKANALKVFLILIYTSIALIIFSNHGLINWQIGFILSCGNMAGAWIGARLSVKWGARYIRYILLISLILVALKLWGVF